MFQDDIASVFGHFQGMVRYSGKNHALIVMMSLQIGQSQIYTFLSLYIFYITCLYIQFRIVMGIKSKSKMYCLPLLCFHKTNYRVPG